MFPIFVYREPPLSEALWSILHGDIIELQDKVYRCISQGFCHEVRAGAAICIVQHVRE